MGRRADIGQFIDVLFVGSLNRAPSYEARAKVQRLRASQRADPASQKPAAGKRIDPNPLTAKLVRSIPEIQSRASALVATAHWMQFGSA